ncbi:hypothetical protein EON76_01265 [bacterium]|nr:MAG: hypothetical protein EON76_01265 [bacterium]
MPSLVIKVKTSITARQFLDALTNFEVDRGAVWGNSQSSHLIVHEVGADMADVTEGSKIFGGVWERLRYDWSNPACIELRTTESNVWANGSGWRYEIEELKNGSGTLIIATVTRFPNSKKGYLLLLFVGSIGKPLIKRGFWQTIRTIERRNQMNA